MRSDDEEPMRRANALPSSVRRAHAASLRPAAAHWLIAISAFAGGISAMFATIALTPLGQATLAFCLFTVPLGISLGLMIGSRKVDRVLTGYIPFL